MKLDIVNILDYKTNKMYITDIGLKFSSEEHIVKNQQGNFEYLLRYKGKINEKYIYLEEFLQEAKDINEYQSFKYEKGKVFLNLNGDMTDHIIDNKDIKKTIQYIIQEIDTGIKIINNESQINSAYLTRLNNLFNIHSFGHKE